MIDNYSFAKEVDFNYIIEKLLKQGIEITLFWEHDKFKYNLNTGMKSHLYIFEENGNYCYEGRYKKTGTFFDLYELYDIVSSCMCGRDFGNQRWIDLLVESGYLTKTIETKISYKV